MYLLTDVNRYLTSLLLIQWLISNKLKLELDNNTIVAAQYCFIFRNYNGGLYFVSNHFNRIGHENQMKLLILQTCLLYAILYAIAHIKIFIREHTIKYSVNNYIQELKTHIYFRIGR